MPKAPAQTDVLVLGDHPCAYLAAAMLAPSLKVVHCRIPEEEPTDRLILINPEIFDLHPMLASLKRKLDLTPTYGLRFLADDPATSSSQSGKSIGGYIGSLKQCRAAMSKLMADSKIASHNPSTLEIVRLDESGVHVRIDSTAMHPKLLIVGGHLPAEQKRMIGLPPTWDGDVLHRYTYLCVKSSTLHVPQPGRALLPMSLDLGGTLNWAWMFLGDGQIQFAVEQPVRSVQQHPSVSLLRKWIQVLSVHGVLKPGVADTLDLTEAESIDLPLAGALSQEGVANRTLLIGPAGGFYTACAEDLYPNCWSAIHACEVVKKAIKERHLQDALQPYRQRWGATLGDYLRGPQQNLRFLLPLVYRNPTMTARLADAILSGKSVVR